MKLGVIRGTVILQEYNPYWKIAFQEEKSFLVSVFKENIIDIQHIGSTSIPNLCAKPLIDIAIKVSKLDVLENEYQKFLQNGYQERVGRLLGKQRVFAKETNRLVTHHLHIIEDGETDWDLKIRFRNTLIDNSELIQEYATLKMELFAKFKNQRLKYTEAKADFIKKVLENN